MHLNLQVKEAETNQKVLETELFQLNKIAMCKKIKLRFAITHLESTLDDMEITLKQEVNVRQNIAKSDRKVKRHLKERM